MKSFKKILCVVLASVLLSASFMPAFAVELEDLTPLYIDKGDIVIGDGTVSGYGYFGQRITTADASGYCIYMAGTQPTTHTITVSGGENYIALKNVTITMNNAFLCAFRVENGAKADIFFTGTNTLTSGGARAGLEISDDSQVTLNGDGVLKASSAGQAGIGGGSGATNGTLIINSGTIIAESTSESAGIGGGSSGSGGTIIINGGNVTARGGSYAAGIGGGDTCDGGSITINGGTVTAIGGDMGAGIGGGWYGDMGDVVINGGSVKAVGGGSAPAIGNGIGLKYKSYPVNDQGDIVYECKIAGESVNKILLNDMDLNICGSHKDDSNYYIYLPEGVGFLAEESENSGVVIYKATVSSNGTATLTEISPVSAINGAEIGEDNYIRGIQSGLTNLDGYLTAANGYYLEYDRNYMGTGTHATVMCGDTPVYSYRTFLYGDVNNDGFYDGEDSFIVLTMLFGLLNKKNTDAILFEAADADRDGVVTGDDVTLLEQAGLLLSTVSQQTGTFITNDAFSEYVCLIDQTPKHLTAQEEAQTEAPTAEEQADDTVPVENNLSFLDFIYKFIKNAVKIISSVYSFWKNYFI